MARNSKESSNGPPTSVQNAVFLRSDDIGQAATEIRGPDFNFPIELDTLLGSYATTGFQASALSRAIDIINKMVDLSVRRRNEVAKPS